MLSFAAFIMRKGFILREGYVCGAFPMSCESNSKISLIEHSPTLGSELTTPWPQSSAALQALCTMPAVQGDSKASLIGHGGMCST